MENKKSESKRKKDPAVAAVLALVGGLIIGFPGIGYIYMDNMKKGLIYGVMGWIVYGIIVGAYVVSSVVTFGIGSILCLPAFALPLVYVIVVTYDTYQDAKGEKTILPQV
ncbi:MAG: hypothetical protein ACP5KP_03625 [Candidatus Micrarchaeia archaeon]